MSHSNRRIREVLAERLERGATDDGEGRQGEVAEEVTDAQLLKEIDAQRLLMIAVATGRRELDDDHNEEYMLRRERIDDALRERGLDNPNPYDDLWSWQAKWSGDLPKYPQRREYASSLYKPLTDLIRSGRARLRPEVTGWVKVDAILRDVAVGVTRAKHEHDHQAIGLLCREALIAVADAVHDPARHPPTDDKTPSKTDAKRRLDAYLAVELQGDGNEEVRRLTKAVAALADAVVHRQSATIRDAALAAEATMAVVNLLTIIAGRRDKPVASIRDELGEGLARAEAEAAEWKQKHDAIVGFSTSATLGGDGVPGTQFIRVVGSQEFDVDALDYCISSGARITTQNVALRGRDVRVPITHSHVDLTFHRGFTGGPHRLDVILRVRLRAGALHKTEEVPARIVQDVGSGTTRLVG